MRKKFSALRAELHDAQKDRRITEFFLSAFPAESFFVYVSFRSEVNTAELVRRLRAAGKRVCLPKIAGKEMFAAPYSENRIRNAFGIEEPVSGGDEPCEVAVTPLLAVDGEGYRLGYGGGYYDRYFAAHPNALRVGLCYAGQAAEKLPHGKFDVPLHAIVTEEGVRFYTEKLDSPAPRGV